MYLCYQEENEVPWINRFYSLSLCCVVRHAVFRRLWCVVLCAECLPVYHFFCCYVFGARVHITHINHHHRHRCAPKDAIKFSGKQKSDFVSAEKWWMILIKCRCIDFGNRFAKWPNDRIASLVIPLHCAIMSCRHDNPCVNIQFASILETRARAPYAKAVGQLIANDIPHRCQLDECVPRHTDDKSITNTNNQTFSGAHCFTALLWLSFHFRPVVAGWRCHHHHHHT